MPGRRRAAELNRWAAWHSSPGLPSGWSVVCVVVGRLDPVAKGMETEPSKLLLDNHYRIFGARSWFF